MSRKPSKTIDEQLQEAKMKAVEAAEDYQTQLYFETMPAIGPTYKYCYATSNFSIPAEQQSIDAWLRAIIKHMALRRHGHGGETTKALVISIPQNLSNRNKELWIEYETRKLRKRSASRAKKVK